MTTKRSFITWLELAWYARAMRSASNAAPIVVVRRLAGKSRHFVVTLGEQLLCTHDGERTLFDSLEAVNRFMMRLGIPFFRLEPAPIPIGGPTPSTCLSLARGRLVSRHIRD